MPTTKTILRIPVTTRLHTLTMPKRRSYSARLGDVAVSGAESKDAAVGALSKQVQALALWPRPMYRQHSDGRGVVIYITGADNDGVVQVSIDMFHANGSPAGAVMFALTKRDYNKYAITIESSKYDVEAALKLELNHYLVSIGGVEG